MRYWQMAFLPTIVKPKNLAVRAAMASEVGGHKGVENNNCRKYKMSHNNLLLTFYIFYL
jgi:hypothetical protein